MADWLAKNSATLLFATAVVLLIALSSWWYVFLARAVDAELTLQARNLALHGQLLAVQLAAGDSLQAEPLKAGPLQQDPRFEICPVEQTPATPEDATIPENAAGGAYFDGEMPVARHIKASWWLCTTDEERQRMVDRRLSRTSMLVGEGLLLSGLLLAVVAMLYRLIRTERRFREEMAGFLRRVTHEMKTPIAGIKAVLQTIQLGRMPEEQLQDLVARALVEAEREEHLISNLLIAQRLRLPGSDLRVHRLDVGELVQRLVGARQAMSKGTAWAVTGGDDAFARADAGAVRTILDNLFDNAAKYGDGSVNVSIDGAGGWVTVVVRDDGIGFVADEVSTLFQPFVRANDSRAVSRTGTGLGLSISLALAQEMGGDIEAFSDGVQRGARFSVKLPKWTGKLPKRVEA